MASLTGPLLDLAYKRFKEDTMEKSNDRIPRAEWRLNEQAQALDVRNAAFKAMSPAEQRVTIAKDVLQWVAERKIIPKTGTYLGAYTWKGDRRIDLRVEEDRVDGGACVACALGSVFACAVEREGGLADFWEYMSQGMQTRHLEPYFSRYQLRLIESAFEQSNFAREESPEIRRAVGFRPDLNCAKDRMRAIMENIIEHDGDFVP